MIPAHFGVHQTISYHRRPDGLYQLAAPLVYFSTTFRKFVTVPKDYLSDGATGAEDIASLSWWVHDWVCDVGVWDDGSICDNVSRSRLISEILEAEGRPVRKGTWYFATYLYGLVRDWWQKRKAR